MLRPLLVAAMLTCLVAAGQAQSRDWQPADRTIVGNFTRITSVAASPDRVFITSPTAVLIWNPQFRNWEGPYWPREAGMLDRVFAGLIDPLDNSLWMIRTDGWVHFDPSIQIWERGLAPGSVLGGAFDLSNPLSGLFLRTSAGWLVAPRGGNIPTATQPPLRPLSPPTINDAIRANPSLASNSAGVLLDNRLRTARYTAAAQGFAGRGWYLGTWGLGLLYLSDGAALPERLTYGLPGDVTGAVFGAPGGVWVATDRTTVDDPAFAFVASDLTDFHWSQGPRATGLPFNQVRRLIGTGSALWAATDLGAARFEPETGRIDLYDRGRGLPDSRVLSIASRRGRVAVGTAHGVALINDSLRIERLAPSFQDPALAVLLSGDTVWVGTPIGLFAALPGEPDLLQPEGLKAGFAFRTPVFGLAWQGDTLVGLTRDRMIWRSPDTGLWNFSPVLSNAIGQLRALVPSQNGFYLAGDRGFCFARLNSPAILPFFIPGDVPGEILDLAVDDDYLWMATASGLVRWRLDAIRP